MSTFLLNKICGFPKIGVPPKSSILIGCSIINHPFWGTTNFGNTHIFGKQKNATSIRSRWFDSRLSLPNPWAPRFFCGQILFKLMGLRYIPSRELTYPTLGKRKIIFKMPFLGDMLIPWRVWSKVKHLKTENRAPLGCFNNNPCWKEDGFSFRIQILTICCECSIHKLLNPVDDPCMSSSRYIQQKRGNLIKQSTSSLNRWISTKIDGFSKICKGFSREFLGFSTTPSGSSLFKLYKLASIYIHHKRYWNDVTQKSHDLHPMWWGAKKTQKILSTSAFVFTRPTELTSLYGLIQHVWDRTKRHIWITCDLGKNLWRFKEKFTFY